MIIEAFRDGILSSSPVTGASDISIVKERSHIAKPLLTQKLSWKKDVTKTGNGERGTSTGNGKMKNGNKP